MTPRQDAPTITADAAPTDRPGPAVARGLRQAALVLLTIAALLTAAEQAARAAFPSSAASTLSCLNLRDPILGVTARPNTACRQKLLEAEEVDYRFNACGHRTAASCDAAVPAGERRVVVVGSSLSEGLGVRAEATFAELIGTRLARELGPGVSSYNAGMQWGTPHSIATRVDDILRARPTIVLWPLSPFDVENASLRLPYIPGVQQPATEADAGAGAGAGSVDAAASAPPGFWGRIVAGYRRHGGLVQTASAALERLLGPLRDARSVFAAQHLLFASQQQYVKHTVANPQSAAFLTADASGGAAVDLRPLERYVTEAVRRFAAAGVPVYIVSIPSHAQLDLLTGAAEDVGPYTPLALRNSVRDISRRAGAGFIDVLDRYRAVTRPGDFFFPVDEHMNERGHALTADLLAEALLADASVRRRLVAPPAASR